MKKILILFISLISVVFTTAFASNTISAPPTISFYNGYGKPLTFHIHFYQGKDTLPGLPGSNFTLQPGQTISTTVLPSVNDNIGPMDTPNAQIKAIAPKLIDGRQPFAYFGTGLQYKNPAHAEVSGRLDPGISMKWRNHTAHIVLAFCQQNYFCEA